MKKLLMCFLLMAWGCIVSSAQEVKKELRTEEDGYKWYETSQNGCHGAESLDGKTIIPLSKKYEIVSYNSPYFLGLYSSDKPGLVFKHEYYTNEGKEILDNSKYDDTYLRGGEGETPLWFITKKDGKEGACDVNGHEIIPPLYEAVIHYQGKFQIKGKNGIWDEYKSQTNNSYASSSTTSNTPSVKDLFELAYNTPDAEAQTKYDKYMEVVKADPYNAYGYKAVAYNNIGVLYDGLGDLKNAKTYFEYAVQVSPKYEQAKDNLKNVKSRLRSQRLNNFSNALGALGQALGSTNGNQTNGAYNSYQGNGGSYSGSSSNSSGGSASGGAASTRSTSCSRCKGSGTCMSVSDRTHCYGSGKCHFCGGDGFEYVAGNPVKCVTCDGTGKCKYCKGSGKCSACGGSGKK